MKYILDASAVLASLQMEPGAEEVEALLDDAAISSINLAEVVRKLARDGLSLTEIHDMCAFLELPVLELTEMQAMALASLGKNIKTLGLSVGDCVCLTLAKSHKMTAVTTDKAWKKLDVGVQIRLIR